MNDKRKWGIFLLLSLSLAASEPKIYVASQANRAERFAAEELARYLSVNLGHDVPIVHRYDGKSAPYLIVGYRDRFREEFGPAPKRSELGDDGFVYRIHDDDLLISGALSRGTLYGVYNYLREYAGWEWYSIDDPGTSRSRFRTPPLPDRNEKHTPRFLYRELFAPEGGDHPHQNFAARLMLNGQLGHRHMPNPEDGYTRMLHARQGWGVDFDNAYNIEDRPVLDGEAYDATRASIRHIMRKEGYGRPQKKLLTYTHIEHIDGSLHSDDPGDLEFARVHKSPAAPMVELTRQVAESLTDKYPHLRIVSQAYLWSLKAPENLRLPDNAGINFSPIELDWSKAINQGTYNQKYFRELKKWTEVTDHIWIWLYTTNFSNYYQPLPTIDAMISTIKRLDKIPQVEGIFLQDSYTTRYGSFSALHAWVYGRLLWNPNLDGKKLVRQFCNGYYGPDAGPLIYRYIHTLQHAADKNSRNRIFTNARLDLPYLDANVLIQADRLFKKAQKRADASAEPRYSTHVKAERLGVDLTMLLNSARLSEEAGKRWPDHTKKAYLRRLDRVRTTIRELGITDFGESSGTLSSILAMLRHRNRIPIDGCKKLLPEKKGCFDFQELGFKLAEADLRYDQAASDFRCASISGDKVDPDDDGSGVGIWGIQTGFQNLFPPSAKGMWDLFAWVRVDPNRKGGYTSHSEAPGFKAGIEGADWHSYPVRRFADGFYHLVKLNDTPIDPGDYSMGVWFSPPDKEQIDDPSSIRRLYVDRLIALPHPQPSNMFALRGMILYDRGAVMEYDPHHPLRYVARMNRVEEGEDAPWAIQESLGNLLPDDGKEYKIYAEIRLASDASVPDEDTIVLRTGVEGGSEEIREIRGSELSKKEYRWIRLPGSYRRSSFSEGEFPTAWFQIDAQSNSPFLVAKLRAVARGETP